MCTRCSASSRLGFQPSYLWATSSSLFRLTERPGRTGADHAGRH